MKERGAQEQDASYREDHARQEVQLPEVSEWAPVRHGVESSPRA